MAQLRQADIAGRSKLPEMSSKVTAVLYFGQSRGHDQGSVGSTYEDPRAHTIRERYRDVFGGPELPVPSETIAEGVLGLCIEESSEPGDCSVALLEKPT